MPNKVTNIVKLQHSDSALILKAVSGFNSTGVLRALLPIPSELEFDFSDENVDLIRKSNKTKFGYYDKYEFCINEWGCTRDIDSTCLKAYVDGNTTVFEFDTVINPPFDVYDTLVELGFDVVSYYYEPDLKYCGIWDNGLNDSVDFSGYSSKVVKNLIDPELDSMFGISESIVEIEEEQEYM